MSLLNQDQPKLIRYTANAVLPTPSNWIANPVQFVETVGAVTITLPKVSSMPQGFQFVFLKNVGGALTLDPQATDTLNDLAANTSKTFPNTWGIITVTALEGTSWHVGLSPDSVLT